MKPSGEAPTSPPAPSSTACTRQNCRFPWLPLRTHSTSEKKAKDTPWLQLHTTHLTLLASAARAPESPNSGSTSLSGCSSSSCTAGTARTAWLQREQRAQREGMSAGPARPGPRICGK